MDNMDYPGIRIHMNARLERLVVPIKIDISTGDVITPMKLCTIILFCLKIEQLIYGHTI